MGKRTDLSASIVAELGAALPAVMDKLAGLISVEAFTKLRREKRLAEAVLADALLKLKSRTDSARIKSTVIKKLQADKAELLAALNRSQEMIQDDDPSRDEFMDNHAVVVKHTRDRKRLTVFAQEIEAQLERLAKAEARAGEGAQ